MEFARRGPATAAADNDVDDGRRFPDPPPQGDPMLVMRDALLSQLQKDRLREEIIVAELAKIESTMALRAADVERAKPWSTFSEEFIMTQRREPVGRDHYADVGEEHDVKLPNKDGRQSSAESKPVIEDQTDECLKPCCNGKEAQPNAAFDEQKLPESNETVPPKKTSPAVKWKLIGTTIPVKKPKSQLIWNCAVCQVRATSERNLQEHCAGQKHKSNVATLESRTKAIDQKAKTTAEPCPGTDQKTSSVKWSCGICQAICTCESDLENHLKGKRHQTKIQALCEEGKNMARNSESQEAKLHSNNVPQHAEKTISTWSCSICQAHCTCESDLENHLKGKRHLLKIQALHEEADHDKNNPPKLAKKENPPSEWNCSLCEAKCNSESQFENHYISRRHQQKLETLQREGKNAKASSLKTANELPSDYSNRKNASSEKVEKQTALNFCKVCGLQCNSEKMLVHHRSGKKHAEKMRKQKALSFCEVCNLQCNSEKVLADHRSGRKHWENEAKVCDLQCNDEKMFADGDADVKSKTLEELESGDADSGRKSFEEFELGGVGLRSNSLDELESGDVTDADMDEEDTRDGEVGDGEVGGSGVAEEEDREKGDLVWLLFAVWWCCVAGICYCLRGLLFVDD